MPPAVKSLLSKFSSTREEDRLDGYTKFLKMGPNLLKFLPGDRAKDLKTWLEAYAFWNAGGRENVATMFTKLGEELGGLSPSTPLIQVGAERKTAAVNPFLNFVQLLQEVLQRFVSMWEVGKFPTEDDSNGLNGIVPGVKEVPNRGLIHPDREGHYFSGPASYLQWYRSRNPDSVAWPTIGILLYRKHVISELPYIPELIRFMESSQLTPLPIFITGVDGHIAVRDLITSEQERAAVDGGRVPANPTLSPEAVDVDAVVSTIGFPLVGGPAGSMEGARQAELAKEILTSKNVPYIVAAPLLIQDVKSWYRQGVAGLQSVVLYSLPELDGAIDAIPLGGLCCGDRAFCDANRHLANCNREGGEIRLVRERLERLATRLKRWTALRRKPASARKVLPARGGCVMSCFLLSGNLWCTCIGIIFGGFYCHCTNGGLD
jgi:magnesium chelatase subunit H